MTLPYTYANDEAVDAARIDANEQYLDGRTSNITGDQVNPYAGIPSTAVGPSLANDANLREDILNLNGRIGTIESAPVGPLDIWNEMLPIEGANPIVVTGTANATGGTVTVTAGGSLKMVGYNFTASAWTSASMDADSVYSLRATVVEGVLTWTLTKLTGGTRFTRALFGAVSSASKFDLGSAIDAMGARMIVLDGSAAGSVATVAFYNSQHVLLTSNLSATPALNNRVGLNLDFLSLREAAGAGGGPSTPQNALVAIVYSGNNVGLAPYILKMPNLGGPYGYGRNLIAETDWSTITTTNNSAALMAFTPPFPGARVKTISGLIALRIGDAVLFGNLAQHTVHDDSAEWTNGAITGFEYTSGVRVGLSGDAVSVSAYQEVPLDTGQHCPSFQDFRAKAFVEFAP